MQAMGLREGGGGGMHVPPVSHAGYGPNAGGGGGGVHVPPVSHAGYGPEECVRLWLRIDS